MNARIRKSLVLLAGLGLAGVALAQSGGGNFQLRWTQDGGGGRSTGGSFAVTGTIGQVDATALMSGGTFSVRGGFHRPHGALGETLFANGFEPASPQAVE
ncbi:hypothetical protein [Tahibacter amnicola]|uniref:Uncharacterized protein n=1 Tax=Tahibacter amnicola TaxID=2976241 RepID=A0ABY6B810_9GAMM|nr:hypothetical protein [Tahibacter amnicola]UXI65814.1 hypothetical protein N4264_13685 [Tahibacter amnicola]